MKTIACLTGCLMFSMAGVAHADDTWRCNSALVSVHDGMAEVLRKCGDPVSRSQTGSVRINAGYGRRVELPTERWTYGPDSGMYHYLRFEGDELVGIASDRG
jgi:hypothetical protein